MASRRMPPVVEEFGQRLLHEAKLAIARASSRAFQSLAEDARRVPEIVREEAAKAEGFLNGFIQSIENVDQADEESGHPVAPRESGQRAGRRKSGQGAKGSKNARPPRKSGQSKSTRRG